MKKLIGLLSILTFSLGFAQQRPDTLVHNEIQEVQLLQKRQRPVIIPQILAQDRLLRLNSYSVADALRYFSGIQIKDYGGVGGLKTVDIRGLGSQHVGVFYDGIQITNAQNGIVDLGKFSIDDLESISLYNGQKSEIFQSAQDYGNSGTIYLKPKTPVFRSGKKTNLYLRMKASSILALNPSVRWEQRLSEQVSSTVTAETLYTDGRYKFRYKKNLPDGSLAYDTVATRHDADVKVQRLEWLLNGKWHTGNWDVHAYAYHSDRGLPGAIVNNHFGDDGQRLKDRNYFVQGNLETKVLPGWKTRLKGKFSYDYTRYIDTLAVGRPRLDNTYLQRQWYGSSSHLFEVTPDLNFNAAVDFLYTDMNANLPQFSYPSRYQTQTAFAGNYQWKGLKFQASLLGTFVKDEAARLTRTQHENKWTPAVFASWQPFENQQFFIHAFYKEIFRLPTFNELYYRALGVSLLKPEYTRQYNLGIQYTLELEDSGLKNISLKADAYTNRVTNKIVSTFNGNMFIWTNTNLGFVKSKGLDVSLKGELQWDLLKLRPLVTYNFLSARDFTNKSLSFYGNQIAYTPRHSGSFSLLTDYDSWGFNYSFVYVGKRLDTGKDDIRTNRLQPWYTHDFSIQKALYFAKSHMQLSFEVNNLFNQHYEVVRNYPMPGRNYRLTLKFIL